MPYGRRTPRTLAVTTAVTTALALGVTAVPLAGPAFAAPATATTTTPAPYRICTVTAAPTARTPTLNTGPLCSALAGLPDNEVSAAQVRVGGNGSWLGTAGVRDRHTGAPAVRDPRFRAGSTTKIVTSAMVLQLAAEGRIDLDGHIQTYLPGLLSDNFGPVTVRQLLNHTSGLRAGAELGSTPEELYAHRFETLTPREVVAASVAAGPESAPGEAQHYLNIHYTVLGLLIEKITNDSYAHQAQVRIFKPLSMRNSYFPVHGDPYIHGPHNKAYEVLDGRMTDVTEWNVTDRFAAGDLISTTADLETLLFALFRGQVVPEPYLQEMFTVPDVPGATIGAGLEKFELNGQVLWGKTGSRPGCHTVIAATRDLARTVVYTVDTTEAKGDGLPIAERFAFPAFTG